MAYNLLAESSKKIKWRKLNKKTSKFNELIELIPISGLGENEGDALGLSIPAKNITEELWDDLAHIINILNGQFNLIIYDLYTGEKINIDNLDIIKKHFI